MERNKEAHVPVGRGTVVTKIVILDRVCNRFGLVLAIGMFKSTVERYLYIRHGNK